MTPKLRTWGVFAAGAALAAAAWAEDGTDAPAPPQATEAVFDAPVEDVWAIFTTAEGWKAFGVAHAEVDFRVGGKIRTHYDPRGKLGDDKTIESTILAFEPHRMLAFRATKAPAGFPFPPETLDRMWSVATFTPAGDGRTRLTLRGHGYGDDDASRRMRAFFEQGNAWTLQRVAAHLAKARGAKPRDEAASPIEAAVVVRAEPADVFRAWTTSEGVRSFFGSDAKVALAPLGAYEVLFDMAQPEGLRGSEGCVVLSWLPDRMLSFTWNAPPEFAHARARRTHVVVEFEPESPGWTRVRVTHLGWKEHLAADAAHAAEWRKVRAYFAAAWPQVLGQLRALYGEEAREPK